MIIFGRLFDKEIGIPDRIPMKKFMICEGMLDKSCRNKTKHTDIEALQERNQIELMWWIWDGFQVVLIHLSSAVTQ